VVIAEPNQPTINQTGREVAILKASDRSLMATKLFPGPTILGVLAKLVCNITTGQAT
jgi:hypothetical protein